MNSKLHIFKLITCLACLNFAALTAQAKDTPLTYLEPAEVEWGSFEHDASVARTGQKLPNHVYEWGWGSNYPWPEGRKIVKKIPDGYTLPEGQSYNVGILDVFVVGGDFQTGVGLLTRHFNMYHQIDYDIPAGSKTFSAKIMIGDDAHFVDWRDNNTNQQGEFVIFIDEKEVYRQAIGRLGIPRGSGETLDEVSIKIPDGAKKIRFTLESSAWGDQGATEIIINDGKFSE
ncbi:hypothetical protein [Geitlerinema calcuttense]|uniref:Glycosyl hydrolase family 98 putative carbohydrate-binding module domain-containing protein n=1 Tax=Geitlerinema calcuttense NRMC-F 0142 TaxID=2922238 RepID=A0ABT7LXA2_9CYAN|nr:MULTISPECIES: hypothetical protein [Cyanophyceae]MDL5055144.1 hypothetical protein [Oscillatoria laete-virens NRMC-F 0139]MDL5056634.1 hypothetical protein [Geitlerinema calcuttense NRMC-F 0142]